jgi:hypothetical protein
LSSNRAAILKEIIAIVLVAAVLLATAGFLIRQVVVAVQALDEADMTDDASGAAFEKALRELADKILTAVNRQPSPPPPPTAPGSSQKPPIAAGKKGEVTTVRFFEAGREIPALKDRRYTSQFSHQASYIYTEIVYRNNGYKIADATIPLIIECLAPDGRKVAELRKTLLPKKDWATAVFAARLGPTDVGGSWQRGPYTFKIYFDGDYIGDYQIVIE